MNHYSGTRYITENGSKLNFFSLKISATQLYPDSYRTWQSTEILTRHNENTTRSLQQTKHELRELQRALPNYWTRLICTHITTRQLSLQPLFAIPNSQPNAESIPLENCRTRHFYQHLLRNKQTPIPSLHRWQQLTNPPDFNHTFWKNTHPTLNTNKQGDVNCKIAHRILPTALSLYRATVYHTPNCHRCHIT